MTIQLHGLKTTGLVPIGGVVATIPALAGAYACSATTAADDLGYVVCGGQVINDATSPLNGRTIPNINNDVFLKGHTTSNTAGGSNTHDHTVPGHYHYYGDHWSNDDSRYGHYPYGNGSGNTLQDGVVYGARATGNGSHVHSIYTEKVSHADAGGWPASQRIFTTSDREHNGAGFINKAYADWNGWHEHTVEWHRHWIQTRTTHGGGLDGRNAMTSGSSSTQPKFITVLYVMRIK
jgi:hypothetical protein